MHPAASALRANSLRVPPPPSHLPQFLSGNFSTVKLKGKLFLDPYYSMEMVKSHGKSESQDIFNVEDEH